MRLLLSYIMSHMYDIHAIIAATVVVAVMSYIKVPVKRILACMVERRVEKNIKLEKKKGLLLRRYNLLLIVFVLSVPVFTILSILSPFIQFSWQSSLMTGVFALCIYAFIEQVSEPVTNAD